MIAHIAVLSLLTTAVLGQSSSNPLIPSEASDGCQKYLKSLNSDKTLDSCATAMVSASSAFAPGNYTEKPSSDTIKGVMDNLCSSSCDSGSVRTSLTGFYSACSAELTSNSLDQVLMTYDVLYTMIPFKNAICTKNDAGNYCLLQSSGSPSAGVAGRAIESVASTGTLSRRAEIIVTTPNATTFQSDNILFLGLSADSDASSLCTSCTSAIMSSYLDFEGQMPYAPGLGQSPLMASQPTLYEAIKSKCGAGFLSSAVQAAGGISSGTGSDSDTSGSLRLATRVEGVLAMLGGFALVSLLL